MEEILKRLELIKSALTVQEIEIVELQVLKLDKLDVDESVEAIVNLLQTSDYGDAIENITAYISKHKNLTIYEDPITTVLKQKLKILEHELEILLEEKSDYLHYINEFNVEYSRYLGDLIEEILSLRMQLSKEELGKHEENTEEYKQAKQQYKQAKKTYDKFHKHHEEVKQEETNQINDDEKKELKQAYKKASKLCHPDVVDENFRKEAEEIFKLLNEAYNKNDLSAVNKILNDLELKKNYVTAIDTITDIEILKGKIEVIKIKVVELQKELTKMKNDDGFQQINAIDDWNKYFEELKCKLESEREELIKTLKNQGLS